MPRGKDRKSIKDVVLVRWEARTSTGAERTKENCGIYGQNRYVSDGDYAGIKWIYPWKGE
jgi:hypothetical protein